MSQQFRPNSFSILPPVVKNLLIINGLFFLATMALKSAFHIDLHKYLSLHYIGASDFSPYQYISYMFMHSSKDFSHILFNMFALWMFGNTLENVWGSKKFLIFYMLTGIGAAIAYTFWIGFEIAPVVNAVDGFLNEPSLGAFIAFTHTDKFIVLNYEIQDSYKSLFLSSHNPTLQDAINFMNDYKEIYLNAHSVAGASGAVYGILVAFGMMFPNQLLYLYFAIPVKAKWVVIGFGALEIYSGISNSPSDNVAHFAHLGGMLIGLVIVSIWKKKGKLYQ